MKKTFLFLLLCLRVYAYDGVILDANSSVPVKNAHVFDNEHSVYTDTKGKFHIDTNATQLHVKAYGYKPYLFETNRPNPIHKLEAIHVKALYLTFWGASNNSGTFKRVLQILEQTPYNAIVVDVKNEYGSTVFWTHFKQANSYGAHLKRTNRNIEKFMQTLKSRGIYTIARIVTFKDELQASNNYAYAIKKNDANKTLWRNHDNMAWVDPFDTRAHTYTIEIAKEAARVGFDEINFDYIRFPARKGLCLSQTNTQKNRVKAITNFLKSAQKSLRPYGVFISVDIYGNTCWSKDDNGIGQTIESLAQNADYICPMLYPSGFASGSFGKKYPAKHPYIVVYRSIKHIEEKIAPVRVRPWLQYFKDYTSARVVYDKKMLQEQIRAAKDANANGWMLWAPSSKYKIQDLY